MFASLGRSAQSRRRLVVIAWFVVLVAGVLFGGQVFARLDGGMGTRHDVESAITEERLAQVGGVGPDLTVLLDGRPVSDPAFRAEVAALARDLRAMPGVEAVVDPGPSGPAGLFARDARAQAIPVELSDALSDAQTSGLIDRIEARAKGVQAPGVLVGGTAPSQFEFQEASQRQLERGEAIALPFVAILLLIIFRGFLAPLLPLAVAVVAVPAALLVLLAVSGLTELSAYSVNVVLMVGLGLAVDYALLMVMRFREERAAGLAPDAAITRTVETAGRTVALSGLTVALALAGLLVFAEPLLRSMAVGAMAVVLLTVAAALTLLPALLAMWGRRIKPLKTRPVESGMFYRLSRTVQRFALPLAPLLLIGLVLLALPFRNAELSGSGPETLPASSPSRQLSETMRDRFPGGGAEPLVVVTQAAAGDRLAATVGDLPGVAAVRARANVPAGRSVLDVTPDGAGQGEVATGLVRQIRDLDVPEGVQVTGAAAGLVDFRDSVGERLPYALALMALATFALLYLMTGSALIPLKALVMSVLSLSASFGALVWIFQDGHLSGPLDFTPVGTIDTVVPLLIFVFAFGLSMDYEVFLLSRIKESHDRTRDDSRAVAVGLQRSGRIVTAAAALMVVVFVGFALGDVLTIKEMGLGMAIAIVVDATVVRSLLVPAVMELMGRWNWWTPAPLRLPRARLEPTDQEGGAS